MAEVGIIIQARTGSLRLPKKVLKKIQGKTVLEHVIERAKKIKNGGNVILATTDKKQDDILENTAKRLNIEVFRGSEEDVLDRYYQTAKLFKIDPIVRITADCPLLDVDIAEKVINFYFKNNYDYVSNVNPPTFPDGMDVEVFNFKTLEKNWKQAKLKSERDGVTDYIVKNPLIFKIGNLSNNKNLSHLRFTLDEKQDMVFIRKIYKELYNKKRFFGLKEILELLKNNPELTKINWHIARNEGSVKFSGIELWNKAKKIIPGGTQLLSKRPEMFLPEHWPCYFQKAKGCEVWDLDNNKYIDMYSMGIGSCVLGYADADVNKAVKKVIDQGNMCTLNSPEEVELAELLIKLHPWAQKVRYARTGGEAMAQAVRIARAYTGKDGVAFSGYHGWHDWYLAANLADDKNLDGHLIPGLDPKGVPRALKGTAFPFNYNKIEDLEEIVSKNKNIGVIVLEPIRYQEPKNNFLQKVRKIADDINAILIFDEISSGFRFNIGGAHLKYKVYPDMAVFAKAMSNGYPMAAIIGKKNVMESAQGTFISSTYWTERTGPAAAIATIKKMIKNNVPQRLEKSGLYLIKNIKKIIEKHNIKMEISGLPALIHFSFRYEEKNLAIQTLFTQEMLRRRIIASAGIYVSYAYKKQHIKKYLKEADEVFGILSKAIKENKVEKLLKGPVAQAGFKRLT